MSGRCPASLRPARWHPGEAMRRLRHQRPHPRPPAASATAKDGGRDTALEGLASPRAPLGAVAGWRLPFLSPSPARGCWQGEENRGRPGPGAGHLPATLPAPAGCSLQTLFQRVHLKTHPSFLNVFKTRKGRDVGQRQGRAGPGAAHSPRRDARCSLCRHTPGATPPPRANTPTRARGCGRVLRRRPRELPEVCSREAGPQASGGHPGDRGGDRVPEGSGHTGSTSWGSV